MTWKEYSRVNERILLIGAYLEGERSMTDICDEFGVSRKTAYKWLNRYRVEGAAGLEDPSRAPLAHPQRVDSTVREALITARKAHPNWGGRKLRAWLAIQQPHRALPAASTISDIMSQYGLTRMRQAKRKTQPYTEPFADADTPNRIWCADFKGDFLTGDGKRCYSLTLTDAHSRMILVCHGLRSTIEKNVKPRFERAFREFGLPERLRTDNGTPFASLGAGGLSRLSIWWLKLGIHH